MKYFSLIIIIINLISIPNYLLHSDDYFLNCGATNTETIDINSHTLTLLKDQEFASGRNYGYSSSSNILSETFIQDYFFSNTDHFPQHLFSNYKLGFDSYKFKASPGNYIVELYFCENYYFNKNNRIQTISINNQIVLKNFDILQNSKRTEITPKRFIIENEEQEIIISSTKQKNNSIINAIRIYKLNQTPPIPNKPIINFQTNGYNQNIIDLNPNLQHGFMFFKVYRKEIGEKQFNLITDKLEKSKFIDNNIIPNKKYIYKFNATNYLDQESTPTFSDTLSPLENKASKLKNYYINIDSSDFQKLFINVQSDQTVKCDFIYSNQIHKNVRIRIKGNSSRRFSKVNFKIIFNDDNLFNNKNAIYLSAIIDPSLARDKLIYNFRKLIGLNSQNTEYIHFSINNKFYGVYLSIEHEDEQFYENRELEKHEVVKFNTNLIIENNRNNYTDNKYQKRNNKIQGQTEIIKFIELINNPNPNFADEIFHHLNIDKYIKEQISVNYFMDIDHIGWNYLFNRSFKTNQWQPLFFDHNYSFVDFEFDPLMGIKGTHNFHNILFDRLMNIDQYRYYYFIKYKEIFNKYNDYVFLLIENNKQEAEFDILRDLNKIGSESPLLYQIEKQKNIDKLNNRNIYLNNYFDTLNLDFYNPINNIYFTELKYSNDSLKVEVYNDNPFPIKNIDLNHNNELIKSKINLAPKTYVILNLSLPFSPNNNLSLNSETNQRINCSLKNILINTNYQFNKQTNKWEMPTQSSFGKENFLQPPKIPIKINEVMASNDIIVNDNGDYSDWIELHNTSDKTVNIGGFYLSDSKAEPFKWSIPLNAKIKPYDFYVIWADDIKAESQTHCNFKLNKEGENLTLYDYTGKNLIDEFSYPKLEKNISFGKYNEIDSILMYFHQPTINNTNNTIGEIYTINNDTIINPDTTLTVIKFNIYGNLFYNFLDYFYQTTSNEKFIFQFFSLNGNLVHQTSITPLQNFNIQGKMKIENLVKGTYILIVKSNNEIIYKNIILKF